MQHATAKAAVIDWLDLSIPDQKLHFELVQALYGTPKSILAASIAALAVIAITVFMSGDASYGWFFAGFLIVGAVRNGLIVLRRRQQHSADDRVATIRWERRALAGAWAFALLVGLVGAYTVLAHPRSDAELLVNCCVMGYIAGISSRNASRPIISIGQVSLTAVPFAVALIARPNVVHVVLAIFLAVLFMSIVMICRAVFENIVSRHVAFRKIELIAQRDPLTDLLNRSAFIESLQSRLDSINKTGESVALVLIDLDRFKDVNDTFGHQTGDLVLKMVGDRIRSAVRPKDQVARIGGDEFIVMLSDASEDEIHAVTRMIFTCFTDPVTVGMTRHFCGASIGYAIAQAGITLDMLFRNADLALYEAKQSGRAQIVRHTAGITERYDRRIELEHDLQHALDNNEFELVYQPIVDPRSRRAICCEALLRWNHPKRGQISPVEFIPIAESTGLIVPIGAWVLATACREATRWPTEMSVAVNLSPVQFRRGNELVDMVVSTLGSAGLAARRLELEITESVLIEDSTTALAMLEGLRGIGVGISLDDFGTGFSSLAYLNDFPFSKIKIDRKFSQGVETSPRTAAIIGGIAKITRDLRIELVAEGIESNKQLQRMLSFGITAVQGFLFCPPLRADKLLDMISAPIAVQGPDPDTESGHVETARFRKVAS
jgi:diguanylate cyclase (GGDEF)-like protein